MLSFCYQFQNKSPENRIITQFSGLCFVPGQTHFVKKICPFTKNFALPTLSVYTIFNYNKTTILLLNCRIYEVYQLCYKKIRP